jgi:hypothetical protein
MISERLTHRNRTPEAVIHGLGAPDGESTAGQNVS